MCWYEQLDEKVREYLPDMTMEREVPLSKHTSFRIGGPARRLAFPANREQLVILMGLAESCGVKPFLLGRGTNLLVDDRGLDTLVIKTAEHMTAVRQLDEVTLEADAGILLNHLAVYAQQHGLSGLEFAHGIPGTLGGAICMNAGAYGGEMRQVVTEVTALLPEGVRRFTAEEAAFGYRRSAFLDTEAVVLGARLRLTPDDPAAIRRRMDDLMARRRQSQPLEYPSAGSTFKRPEGYFAGTLIEQTGLKGLTVGGAQVSTKHAGFVINVGGATPPTACIWSRRCGSSAEKGTSMEILIITGLSGGGKSRAASYLEDIGYYTVDNLPAEMMVKFADFCAGSSGRYDRVALVYDVRSGEPTDILIETLERLKASGVNCRMLFLEADNQTIVNRYKETRRMHPLQKKGESVEQAIRREREWMQPVRDHADFVLDTSALSIAKLRSELLDLFGQQGDRGGLAVNILSFGFKHGIPIEADLVFDVRFMPNPYYVPELKNKTGLDQAVRDFVFSFRQTNDFMEQLEKMLTFLLPLYAEEGKSALVIAIGCTGGHHRSVAVAHELAEYITEEGYQVTENHRDISR